MALGGAISTGESVANPADAKLVIGAALAASMIGALFYNLLPLYLGTAADSKALSNEQAGLLGAAFFLGFNVSGASAFLWVRRWHWRSTSFVLLATALLSLLACMRVANFEGLAFATALGGVGFGGLFCIAGVMLGDTSTPARWYGVKTAVESIVGAGLIIVLTSSLSPASGFNETAVGMIVLCLILSPALLFLPPVWRKDEPGSISRSPHPARSGPGAIWFALAVVLTFFAGNSGLWAFAERIGASSGFDPAQVGVLLSATLIFGVAGSLSVAAIGNRFGTFVPFCISAALIFVALCCLSVRGEFWLYAIGVCLQMIGWSAGVPLAFAEVANLDRDGRFVALGTPALGIGSMIGPAGMGWLVGGDGAGLGGLVFAGALVLVSLLCIWMSHRLGASEAAAPVPSVI